MAKETRSGSKSLEELIELAEQHVRDIFFVEKLEGFAPLWYLVSKHKGQDCVVLTPWDGDLEKEHCVNKVKELAHSIEAEALCFSTECWMLDIKEGSRQERLNERPSESPNRIEAVLIIAHGFDGADAKRLRKRTIAKSLRMIRDKPGGRLIALENYGDMGDGTTYDSWMLRGMIRA